jgi:hypothetical protein
MNLPEPLTPTERVYLRKWERLLMQCPERLEFVTIGDADLTVIDKEASDSTEYTNGIPQHIILGSVRAGCLTHAVAG